MSLQALPYMKPASKVTGAGSTQPTLFGVMGMFAKDERFAGVQQQIIGKPSVPGAKLPPLHAGSAAAGNTDRDLLGPPAKTRIPPMHYGMVPFAGHFMSAHGDIEVYGRESKKEKMPMAKKDDSSDEE
jgi:hypothetical protein